MSKIDFDLALEPLLQKPAAVIVEAAPAHVDCLDAARRRRLDRFEIAAADQEIVLHDLAERRQREAEHGALHLTVIGDVEHQPVVLDREVQVIGPGAALDHLEGVLLQKVEDRDLALMVDIGRQRAQAVLVDRHRGQTVAIFSSAGLF